MCLIEYSIVWFTHCLVYLAVYNTDSSTRGSTCLSLNSVIISVLDFYCNFAYRGLPLVSYVILCDVCYCIVLYCIVLYCNVLSCLAL